MTSTTKRNSKQECIPVGCVLAAHWPYARVCFGGCLLRGVCLLLGGVYPWGVCLLLGGLPPGGVSALGGVCSWGVSAPRGGCLLLGGLLPSGGCLLLGGCLLPGGSGIPACTEADTPPVNRMTNRCKNITLATTSLRPVKILIVNSFTVNIWTNYSKDGNDKRVTLFVEETFYLLSVLIWIL